MGNRASSAVQKEPEAEVFRWEFDKMSDMFAGETSRESPVFVIGGLSWKILLSIRTYDDQDFLGVYLACSYPGANKFWKCENRYSFKFIHRTDELKSKAIATAVTEPFFPDSNVLGVGIPKAVLVSTILDEDEGFLQDDKIIVEVNLTIVKTYGVGTSIPLRDFSEPDETCDVCLIVEGKQVHVARANLAMHSPTFKTMFYGEFVESGKREIEIQDVKHAEFVQFLNVTYTSLYEIKDESVESILALADSFNTKIVLDAAEMFLMTHSNLGIAKKLLLTDLYKLDNAQSFLLYSVKTTNKFKEIKSHESYVKFSETLKSRVGERILEIVNSVL